MKRDKWPEIAVLGAGAVGCYFGGLLARAGAPVTLIGRAQHVEAINKDGLFLDTLGFQERVIVKASTEVSAAQNADIVLLCVKALDTEYAAQALEDVVAPEALVLSCQNGVDNVKRIRAVTRLRAIPAVTYVAAAMSGQGRVKHSGQGSFVIGNLLSRVTQNLVHATTVSALQAKDVNANDEVPRSRLEEIATIFKQAGIGCLVSDNVEGELWKKMIMNCAYNAISALGRSKYAVIGEHELTREVISLAVMETIAVAQSDGVRLPEGDLVKSTLDREQTMINATSSTAQDIGRGKRTEIDFLNGYVVRRGREMGIATPVNQTLHALVKLLEENSCRQQEAS